MFDGINIKFKGPLCKRKEWTLNSYKPRPQKTSLNFTPFVLRSWMLSLGRMTQQRVHELHATASADGCSFVRK